MRVVNLRGNRFGRLLVTARAGTNVGGVSRIRKAAAWLCRCDCGKDARVTTGNLKSGHTMSCGCLSVEALAENRKRIRSTEADKEKQAEAIRRMVHADVMAHCRRQKMVPTSPDHRSAKTYVIRDPAGKIYTVRNLRGWCKLNEHLFAPIESVGERPLWERAAHGISHIGKGCGRSVSSSWYGWTLITPIEQACGAPDLIERATAEPALFGGGVS